MPSIFSYWSLDIWTILFIAGLCVLYLYAVDFKIKQKASYFFIAIILILLCVVSPLHFIGMHYLFSVHMVSHIILLLLAGPLIIAGIPEENKFKKELLVFSVLIKKHPIISWGTGLIAMWFWHVPYIFDHFGMHAMSLMRIQSLSLLIAGMIFAWPILTPYRNYRINPVSGVLYLATACVFCSILGLLITFAPLGTYNHYLNISDNMGYLSMIRNNWQISAIEDQQAAGLIMWVPCCFVYLTASMALLLKWFNEDGRMRNGIKNLKNTQTKFQV